ncbi:MAG: hypothetical protein PWQ58_267 [Archaeoglobaceae archaeon]|nr:hypothetical protein [Archaeoglobaceae archaeon]
MLALLALLPSLMATMLGVVSLILSTGLVGLSVALGALQVFATLFVAGSGMVLCAMQVFTTLVSVGSSLITVLSLLDGTHFGESISEKLYNNSTNLIAEVNSVTKNSEEVAFTAKENAARLGRLLLQLTQISVSQRIDQIFSDFC